MDMTERAVSTNRHCPIELIFLGRLRWYSLFLYKGIALHQLKLVTPDLEKVENYCEWHG